MQSLTAVKDLNILKHGLFGFISSLVDLMMYQLCFQGVEEAFRHRVIPAVTFATHALPLTSQPLAVNTDQSLRLNTANLPEYEGK